MQIRALKLRNFRSFREVTLEFSNPSVLIGGTGSGKTTILDAIDLVLTPRRWPVIDELDFTDREVGQLDDPVTLCIEVVLGDLDEPGRFADRLEVYVGGGEVDKEADLAHLNDDQAVVRMALQAELDPETGEFSESFIFPGFPLPDSDDFEPLGRSDRRSTRFLYLPSPRRESDSLTMAWWSPLGRLLHHHDVHPAEALRQLARTLEGEATELLASVENLDQVRDDIQSVLEAASPESWDLDFGLFTGSGRELLRAVQATLPTPSDGRVPISGWSQGERAVAALAIDLALARRNPPAIIAIDEPELHLGPARQRNLIDALRNEGGQLLLATQSPDIVRSFDLETIVATRRTERGPHVWRPPAAHAPTLLRIPALMPQVAEGLSARATVVCEGRSDVMSLETMALRSESPSFDAQEAVLVEGEGSQVRPVAELFADVGTPVVVVVDDANTQEQRTDIDTLSGRQIPVIVIEDGRLEDLLVDPLTPGQIREFVAVARERYGDLENVPDVDDVEDDRLAEWLKGQLINRRGKGRLHRLLVETTDPMPERWLRLVEAVTEELRSVTGRETDDPILAVQPRRV